MPKHLRLIPTAEVVPAERRRPSRVSPPEETPEDTSEDLRNARDLGAELLASGDLEGSLAAFREAVRLAPDGLTYRQKVAELLQRMGRTREALAEYQVLAESWSRTGWVLRAIAVCKVMLQLDLRHAWARSLLEELQARRGLPHASSRDPLPPCAVDTKPERLLVSDLEEARKGALRGSPVFSGLSPSLRGAVEDSLEPVVLQAGERILNRGEAAQALFVLLRGRCSVFHPHLDGHETAYVELKEGDVFGEISLLRSKLVTASVRTVTACLLMKLERSRFDWLLQEAPGLRLELLRLGAGRLSRTSDLLSRR
ncbi:cyclic nucleotide-binding domain-containing protein [Myxococcus sp. K38C18041901]|uniref:cyclic nucleotide-binding domain-containing protein n=1 Tax=Myxococcus guangdongensis TaxID=2906760 RepID=UPI0020A7F15C|nr:cyclic nucleotide-binding domain-containing protein [Myxococcus guangdongensis]MCP3065174.1 cyclic nucleotide-binding domain-containing protein [Myxococcus guangdongensis]